MPHRSAQPKRPPRRPVVVEEDTHPAFHVVEVDDDCFQQNKPSSPSPSPNPNKCLHVGVSPAELVSDPSIESSRAPSVAGHRCCTRNSDFEDATHSLRNPLDPPRARPFQPRMQSEPYIASLSPPPLATDAGVAAAARTMLAKVRPRLGITVSNEKGPEQQHGGHTEPGVTVIAVRPGGPGEAAGIRPGDRLLRLAGVPVIDSEGFCTLALRLEPGQRVTAVVMRRAGADATDSTVENALALTLRVGAQITEAQFHLLQRFAAGMAPTASAEVARLWDLDLDGNAVKLW
eukprot:TRINITY_DN17677_c0_g1_i1.p1 TRINITY_DN17677_c0_g1~~TRINITY_DN17677_c0_g1_i1.p1  ORF type:complete len:289 (-),score=27.56 TRINITY_DN17677_c0_g1_i1:121-987(-)